MDDGEEQVGDPAAIQQMRGQVLKVYAKSFATALLLTGLAMIIPGRVKSVSIAQA